LELEDYDSQPLERNHELGVEHWNAGRFFPAHEAWETCWKQAKQTPEAEFFKGLSQLGAGYVHLLRGNQHGAFTLLRRGSNRILQYPDSHRGVDVRKVAAAVLSHALYIELAERNGRPSVDLTPPLID
jgi:predicted metal-dependent hydrolase